MSSNITAFIHATVAYTNLIGQTSLILETLYDKPVVINAIQACLDVHEIAQIIVVTSDQEKDNLLLETIAQYFPSKSKPIRTHRIASEKAYSFVPQRKKMREAGYPYMWKPYYGLYTLSGYQELTNLFATEKAIIIDPSLAATLSTPFLSALIVSMGDKVIQYGFSNPYRRVYGLTTSFFNELIDKNKGKIHFEIAEKGDTPHIDDVFQYEKQEHTNSYYATNNALYSLSFYPVLRRRDIQYAQDLAELNLNNYKELFVRYSQSLVPLTSEYCDLELFSSSGEELPVQQVKEIIEKFSWGGIALDFTGDIDPCRSANLAYYISFAKSLGIISLWLETDGTFLSSEKLDELVASGLDLFIIKANHFVGSSEALSRTLETLEKKRKSEIYPLCVLVFDTDPWLTAEQENMIELFKKRVDRIIIRALPEAGKKRGIDFAPLERTVCQQILNSLFVRGSGRVALCSRDESGYVSLDKATGSSLHDARHTALLKEQMKGIYGETFEKCKTCSAWYLPNVRHGFFDVAFPRLESAAPLRVSLFHTMDSETLSAQAKELEFIIDTFEATQKTYRDIERDLHALKKREPKALRGILESKVGAFKSKIDTLQFLRNAYNQLYIPIGEQFIALNMIDEALKLWENVLRTDPLNAHIHARLDELLEKV